MTRRRTRRPRVPVTGANMGEQVPETSSHSDEFRDRDAVAALRSAAEAVEREVGETIVGQHEAVRGVLIRADRRRPRAARGRSRPRQDAAGRRRSRGARRELRTDPVHPRPDARRHHRHRRPRRGRRARRAAVRVRAGAALRATSCWPTRSTAPRRRTQSALLEAMQERTVTVGRDDPRAARAVLRCSPRRTRWRCRAPTRSPRRSSTASS